MGFFDFMNDWAEKTRKNSELQKQKAELNKKVAIYEFEKPQLQKINAESAQIIENTKDLKVAMGRFDTIRNNCGRLLTLNPHGTPVPISIGKWVTNSEAATYQEIMVHIEKAKRAYTQSFYTNKINAEILKADHLTDTKLKKTQLRKALKAALDSSVKLPKDPVVQGLIVEIEGKLTKA